MLVGARLENDVKTQATGDLLVERPDARREHLARRQLPTLLVDVVTVPYMNVHTVVVGSRGRIVVPAEVRQRAELSEGVSLVLLETPDGMVLLTRKQLRDRVRNELEGLDLVSELLAERRNTAKDEDAV